MMTYWLLFAAIFPILPIFYFLLRNETKPKKNVILGVTLPIEARNSSEVQELCGTYRKSLGISCLLVGASILPTLFSKHFSIILTVFLLWVLAAIAAPYAVYTVYHRRLKRTKRERGWMSDVSSLTLIDMRSAQEPKRLLSVWWFLPPFVVSLIPLIWELTKLAAGGGEWALLIVYSSNALITGIFWPMYRLINRQRGDVVGADATLNAALSRVRRYNWGKFLLTAAWLTGAFSICFIVWFNSAWGITLSTIVYTLVLLLASMQTEFAVRRAQQALTVQSGSEPYADEDSRWINGIFYYNPNDRHFMVNVRVGLGMTMNLARPAAKLIMGLVVLSLLSLPLIGGWMMWEEFTPPRVVLSETQVIAQHTGQSYVIDLDGIESAELLWELPQSFREWGTGFESLNKGMFRVDGIGMCELNLNPQCPPFLKLEATGKIYIIGSNNPSETQSAFDALQHIIKQEAGR